MAGSDPPGAVALLGCPSIGAIHPYDGPNLGPNLGTSITEFVDLTGADLTDADLTNLQLEVVDLDFALIDANEADADGIDDNFDDCPVTPNPDQRAPVISRAT